MVEGVRDVGSDFGVQGLDAEGLSSELQSPYFWVRISLILKCRAETGRQGRLRNAGSALGLMLLLIFGV